MEAYIDKVVESFNSNVNFEVSRIDISRDPDFPIEELYGNNLADADGTPQLLKIQFRKECKTSDELFDTEIDFDSLIPKDLFFNIIIHFKLEFLCDGVTCFDFLAIYLTFWGADVNNVVKKGIAKHLKEVVLFLTTEDDEELGDTFIEKIDGKAYHSVDFVEFNSMLILYSEYLSL